MSAQQPQITKAKLLYFQALDADVDVLGTIVPGDKNIAICHEFVYAYLEAQGILVKAAMSNDFPSKIYGDSGFTVVAGPPQAGDIILLGGESHSMIALTPRIWVGVNNMGLFFNSIAEDNRKHLYDRCVIEIPNEDLSRNSINFRPLDFSVPGVKLEIYRNPNLIFPPFEMSQLRLWQPVPLEEADPGCCMPM